MLFLPFTGRCNFRSAILGNVDPELSHELVIRLRVEEGCVQGYSQKGLQYDSPLGSSYRPGMYERHIQRWLYLGYRYSHPGGRSERWIYVWFPNQSYWSQPKFCWHHDVYHQLLRHCYIHYRAADMWRDRRQRRGIYNYPFSFFHV